MHYIKNIEKTTDIEFLRRELLAAQKLNQELHRRAQAVEGMDVKYHNHKANVEMWMQDRQEEYKRYKEWYKKRILELREQIYNLPYLIRLIYKL